MSICKFGDFRLDLAAGQLRRGDAVVPLAPKAFTVLQHLVTRSGQLITKDELLELAWADVHVGDGALKVCIREIRRALDDDPRTPAYIETAHRRGYRFVAPVSIDTTAPVAPGLTVVPAGPASTVMSVPETHYARSGDVNIAYQVIGSGPRDLVFIMGWVSHLEYFWAEPSFARFLLRLASFSRLILIDKRGTGLSDRVTELPTLEQRMDDVRAVMEQVGSNYAALIGVSEGGPMCALFAATYPEKTRALVMIGTYAKRLWDPEYPWGPTHEAREAFYARIRDEWGGPIGLEERAPTVAADPAFRAWWATYLRMGASPGAALALTRMNAEIDIRDILPSIRVPTLVLHRRHDHLLNVEEGRYVASRIPGARFVELPGQDHLPFVGDQDAIIDEIERFVTGAPAVSDRGRRSIASSPRSCTRASMASRPHSSSSTPPASASGFAAVSSRAPKASSSPRSTVRRERFAAPRRSPKRAAALPSRSASASTPASAASTKRVRLVRPSISPRASPIARRPAQRSSPARSATSSATRACRSRTTACTRFLAWASGGCTRCERTTRLKAQGSRLLEESSVYDTSDQYESYKIHHGTQVIILQRGNRQVGDEIEEKLAAEVTIRVVRVIRGSSQIRQRHDAISAAAVPDCFLHKGSSLVLARAFRGPHP